VHVDVYGAVHADVYGAVHADAMVLLSTLNDQE
jgi:hypothetical protein